MRLVRPSADLLAAIVIFLFTLWIAGGANATTASVHIEWKRGATVYGAQSLTSTGSSAASSAAPNFDGSGTAFGVVRITATQGAAIVIVGAATPTATQTNGVYIAKGGGAVELPVSAGQMVAIIPATDQPTGAGFDVDGPATDAIDVTPSDSTVLANVRGLYVGTTGNVAVKFPGDASAHTFTAVPAGAVLPVAVDHVMSTGTTASTLEALQ